jgi:hypothetical protein
MHLEHSAIAFGRMDAFITHACRWMDAVLNFMLAEPRAIARRAVLLHAAYYDALICVCHWRGERRLSAI